MTEARPPAQWLFALPGRLADVRTLYGRSSAVPLQSVGGRLVSAHNKSGDPACSAAASAWRRHQATPDTYKTLAKCKLQAKLRGAAKAHRNAGNEAKAQVAEHRAAAGKVGKANRDRLAELAKNKLALKRHNRGVKAEPAATPKGEPKAAPAKSAPSPARRIKLKPPAHDARTREAVESALRSHEHAEREGARGLPLDQGAFLHKIAGHRLKEAQTAVGRSNVRRTRDALRGMIERRVERAAIQSVEREADASARQKAAPKPTAYDPGYEAAVMKMWADRPDDPNPPEFWQPTVTNRRHPQSPRRYAPAPEKVPAAAIPPKTVVPPKPVKSASAPALHSAARGAVGKAFARVKEKPAQAAPAPPLTSPPKPTHLEVETIGGNKGWVAEITGRDPKYGFARQFVGDKDYGRANKPRTRGVYTVARLHPGKVYEVNHPTAWGKVDRYFATAENGEIRKLSVPEVHEHLDRLAGQ